MWARNDDVLKQQKICTHDNLAQLLYGIGLPPAYTNASFSKQAAKHGLPLPSVHVVPLNRSTQYDKKASKAFSATRRP